MRLLRIQVTMTHNQRLRITLMQILQQTSQRTLLRLGSGVAGSLAVSSKPSYVCHPDRVPVMVLAVRPHHFLWSSRLNGAVRRDNIMISTSAPSERTMIAVDVRHPKGTARPVGGAVHDNKSNSTHRNFNFLILNPLISQQRCDSSTSCSRQNQFNHSDYVEHDALPVLFHTCSC